jgi:uncharacterized protein YcfJ
MQYIESTTQRRTRLAGAAPRRDSRRGRRACKNNFSGVGILLLAALTNGNANAVQYQAFAPVLKVEPVMETTYEPVTREVCTAPDASAREFNAVAATIGEDIRQQNRLWQQHHRCNRVTEQRPSEHIVGYRVTYRYGAETRTTRMSYDPGERIPVNVSLSPL